VEEFQGLALHLRVIDDVEDDLVQAGPHRDVLTLLAQANLEHDVKFGERVGLSQRFPELAELVGREHAHQSLPLEIQVVERLTKHTARLPTASAGSPPAG